MKISLAKLNNKGSSAILESQEEFEDSFIVAEGRSYSANKACRLASERLRKMADRFDLLAVAKDPYNINTHREINT